VRRPLCGSPTRSAEQTVYKQSRDLHTAVAGACGNNDDVDDDDNDDDDDVTAFTRSRVITGNVRCCEYLINSAQFECSLDKSKSAFHKAFNTFLPHDAMRSVDYTHALLNGVISNDL